jgi:chromosome segregation ATPase
MSASNLPENRLNHRNSPGTLRRLFGFLHRDKNHRASLEKNLQDQDGVLPPPSIQLADPETEPDQAVSVHPESRVDVSKEDASAALIEREARLAETEARLGERAEQVEALTAEVERTHALLVEREAMLQAELNTGLEQRAALDALQATEEVLIMELHAAQTKIEETVAERNNLQAALTANIQHAAEQQDALLRWQELAESADERFMSLENQVTALRQALHDCNDQRENLHQEVDETSQMLAEAQTKLAALNHHQETEDQLAESREQVAKLERALEQDVAELAWYKVSFANSQAAVMQLEQQLGEQSAALEMTRSRLANKEVTIDKSRTVFARLAASLRLKDEREKRLQGQLGQLAVQIREERALWYKTLKRNEVQLAATEAELERHWLSYRAQGQRLAELQSVLIEREQELATTKAQIKQQEQLVRHLRDAAGGRVNELETALDQAEQQIRDLQLIVERRSRRETTNNE